MQEQNPNWDEAVLSTVEQELGLFIHTKPLWPALFTSVANTESLEELGSVTETQVKNAGGQGNSPTIAPPVVERLGPAII